MNIAAHNQASAANRTFQRQRFLAAICCLILAAGCVLTAADKPLSDEMIYDRVIRSLVNDRILKTNQLTVAVKDAVVTVTGQVENEKLRRRVGKVVKDTKGVKDVVNQVTVR